MSLDRGAVAAFILLFQGGIMWFIGGGGRVIYCQRGWGMIAESCDPTVVAANSASAFAAGSFGILFVVGFWVATSD